MSKPRIILADDHRIVLEGLRGLLEEHFDLVGTATNGRELIAETLRLKPDVVVADISMPLLNGIDAVQQLREAGCRVKVVFLTMHADPTYATRAMQAGASGYVLKHSASDELVTAIEAALRHRTFVSPAVNSDAMAEALAGPAPAAIEITGRQREVLQLLAEGKSAKEIGGILGISARTVEAHKYRMMDDLGVKSSAQRVQYAIRHGIGSVQ